MDEDSFKKTLTYGVIVVSALTLGGCESLGIENTSSLLLPTLHRSEVFGFVAGFGTTFAAVPDLIGMLRRGPARASTRRWLASSGCFKLPGSITVS